MKRNQQRFVTFKNIKGYYTLEEFVKAAKDFHDPSRASLGYFVNEILPKIWNESPTVDLNAALKIEHAIHKAQQRFMNKRVCEAVSAVGFSKQKRKYARYGISWGYKHNNPLSRAIWGKI